MAKWAKKSTKCRICNKKIDDTRLVCVGVTDWRSFSIWFRERCNLKQGDYRSVHSITIQNYLNMLDSSKWSKWYDADYRATLALRRESAVKFFKDKYNIDVDTCPPIYGENSGCLAQLRNWAKEQRFINNFEVTDGFISTPLLILVDEYLMSH